MTSWCDKCSVHHSQGEHLPVFAVARDEGDSEDEFWLEYHARSAEHAARKWADSYDCDTAEYSIVGGRYEPVVMVRDEDGKISRFRVSGEAVPSYTARAVTAESRERP